MREIRTSGSTRGGTPCWAPSYSTGHGFLLPTAEYGLLNRPAWAGPFPRPAAAGRGWAAALRRRVVKLSTSYILPVYRAPGTPPLGATLMCPSDSSEDLCARFPVFSSWRLSSSGEYQVEGPWC